MACLFEYSILPITVENFCDLAGPDEVGSSIQGRFRVSCRTTGRRWALVIGLAFSRPGDCPESKEMLREMFLKLDEIGHSDSILIQLWSFEFI